MDRQNGQEEQEHIGKHVSKQAKIEESLGEAVVRTVQRATCSRKSASEPQGWLRSTCYEGSPRDRTPAGIHRPPALYHTTTTCVLHSCVHSMSGRQWAPDANAGHQLIVSNMRMTRGRAPAVFAA